MPSSKLFKNPYFYVKEDFEKREKSNTYDGVTTLTDSSGYLCLRDQINIIKSQSAINNEFRRGQIDKYNEDKKAIIEQLASFEDNDYVVNQLYQARTGDLIDKSEIYKRAYDAGRLSGFYSHNSQSAVKEPPSTLGDGANESQKDNTE